LEDTHTPPGQAVNLAAVLALTVTLCVKTGVAAGGSVLSPSKNMVAGWSLFALGIGVLRKITIREARSNNRIPPTAPVIETSVNELKSIGV